MRGALDPPWYTPAIMLPATAPATKLFRASCVPRTALRDSCTPVTTGGETSAYRIVAARKAHVYIGVHASDEDTAVEALDIFKPQRARMCDAGASPQKTAMPELYPSIRWGTSRHISL